MKNSNLLFGTGCHNRVVQKNTLLLILEQSSDRNTKPLNTRLTDGHKKKSNTNTYTQKENRHELENEKPKMKCDKSKTNEWLKKKQNSSFSFPLNVQRALIAERIIQFLRRTPEHDGSGSSVTAFGTEQQGVGPFQGFGKCAESQRRTKSKSSPRGGVPTAELQREERTTAWKLLSQCAHAESQHYIQVI